MNFYHESYEKHMECESRVAKSKEGLGKLTQKIEEIKQGSSQLIQRTLKVIKIYTQIRFLLSNNKIHIYSRIRNTRSTRIKSIRQSCMQAHQSKAIYIYLKRVIFHYIS